MYTIIVKNKEGKEVTSYSAEKINDEISVGRESLNNIILNDQSISSTHCIFAVNRKKIIIKNVKSRNGIIVNGERLKKETYILNDKDDIKCGDFSFEFIWKDNEKDEVQGKSKNIFLNGLIFIFLIAACLIILILIKPEPIQPVKIGEVKPITKNENPSNKTSIHPNTVESWRILLSKGKDAYFNDNILKAAECFKEVIKLQSDNIEANNFLDQIKKEFVPKIEEAVEGFIEERNIVSCAKAVKELMILNPESEWIKKANNLLDGYKKFDEIRNLFQNHRFKEAKEKIQNIVLVDEETLSLWRLKIDNEVFATNEFESALIDYINGDLASAYKKFKKFISKDTLQNILKTVADDKMRIMKMYNKFKKLEKKDPLKQSSFGVEFLYEINSNDDPYIYENVTKRLNELEKECGKGTDFYLLLKDDTMSQLEQGRDYKVIKETQFALKNYKNAINGLRILAYFSKEEEFINLEKEAFNEIKEYEESLKTQIEKMKTLNEFEGAEKINKLLKKYEVLAPKESLKIKDLLSENQETDESNVLTNILSFKEKSGENKNNVEVQK